MIDHGRISAIRPTARVERLRAELIASKPILCSERALLVTESYRQTESEPAPIRRAKAFAHILENMTPNIYDGELIVGSHGSNGRRSAPVFPEYAIDWLMEELDETLETRPQDTFVVPAQVKADLHAVAPYWRGRTVHEKYRALLPGDAKRARDAYLFTRDLFERSGYGHTCYQMEKLLKAGAKGFREEVKG
ncbi:MAG TPA: pyruvate formate lyase family protein, partial [Clostridia bacterium]|nr:pyruvate formate lyase family protein [Clostridia bacterium]